MFKHLFSERIIRNGKVLVIKEFLNSKSEFQFPKEYLGKEDFIDRKKLVKIVTSVIRVNNDLIINKDLLLHKKNYIEYVVLTKRIKYCVLDVLKYKLNNYIKSNIEFNTILLKENIFDEIMKKYRGQIPVLYERSDEGIGKYTNPLRPSKRFVFYIYSQLKLINININYEIIRELLNSSLEEGLVNYICRYKRFGVLLENSEIEYSTNFSIISPEIIKMILSIYGNENDKNYNLLKEEIKQRKLLLEARKYHLNNKNI